ncbi:MAG: radical SAM protein [Nocardiopsaceae bacterium]|nr:radical SAM protein [Nocardiopsaceae bacterium]
MLSDRAHAERLSREWGVHADDIMLIALNSCGLQADIDVSRLRFRIRLDSRPDEQLYMILSLGRAHSPFELVDHEIRLNGKRIAIIDSAEEDDAVLGYWRKDRRVLTLNSNSRSQCIGCVFCPNTLEDASDPRLTALDDLHSYFSALVENFSLADMTEVERVTVCTGCFKHEHLALQHLQQVREAMTEQNCSGIIHFLSSILTTTQGMDAAADISPFHLTLTAECFTQRGVILKESKANLTPAEMVRVLGDAAERSIMTDFTYIVGLDSPEVALQHLADFVPVTTTFPRFQIYQSHNNLMDLFIADGARDIDFYLYMRREIEDLFGPTGLRPKPWENYRPLWYFTFADEPLRGERI